MRRLSLPIRSIKMAAQLNASKGHSCFTKPLKLRILCRNQQKIQDIAINKNATKTYAKTPLINYGVHTPDNTR